MLKILFSYDEFTKLDQAKDKLLDRVEIIALFNTFTRLSESLGAIEDFRGLLNERKADRRSPAAELAPDKL